MKNFLIHFMTYVIVCWITTSLVSSPAFVFMFGNLSMILIYFFQDMFGDGSNV